MKKIIKYLSKIDGWLYIVLFFCVMGVLRNALQFTTLGFNYHNIAIKILVAMIVLYLVQISLILLRERKAWIVSAIQVFFCIYVYEDFTFFPLANMIRSIVWHIKPDLSFEWVSFMWETLVSAMFCLEILKTYLIYTLTDDPYERRRKRLHHKNNSEIKEEAA